MVAKTIGSREEARSVLQACVDLHDAKVPLTETERRQSSEALQYLRDNPAPVTPAEYGFGDEDRIFGRGD